MRMEIMAGSATTPYERAQLHESIPMLYPSAWATPETIIPSYMPLAFNVDYNGYVDCSIHPSCYWQEGTTSKAVSANNSEIQYGVFKVSSPAITLHYNNLETGDIVHLFDFTFGSNTIYSEEVRVYDSNIDPDFLEPGFHGLLLGEYFDFAIPEEKLKSRIKLRVYLQGSIMGNDGAIGSTHNRPLMRDNLRYSPFDSQRYIPNTSPYVMEVGKHTLISSGKFEQMGYGGEQEFTNAPNSIFQVTGEDAIVDWVFVELRDADNSDMVVASRSALVQRDGDVVDVDGNIGIRIPDLAMGNYYVVVHHRNHLPSMSATPVSMQQLTSLYDFTDINTPTFDHGTSLNNGYDYTGLGQNKTQLLGYQCLWAGDANNNGKVNHKSVENDANIIYNDIFGYPIDVENGVYSYNANFDNALGYNPGDINLDSKSKFVNPNDDTNILKYSLHSYPLNTAYTNYFDLFDEQLKGTQRIPVDTSPEAGNLKVKLKVYLQGSIQTAKTSGIEYSSTGKPLMSDEMRSNSNTGENYIPISDPYQVEQTTHTLTTNPRFQHVGPGANPEFLEVSNPSALFSITGEGAIVDWVFVELRSKDDYSQVIATRAGLVQRDGNVVDVDGSEGLSFPGIAYDNYFVAVKHRNHLGAMTGCAYHPELLNTMVDFTNQNTDLFDFGEQNIPNPPYANVNYNGLSQNTTVLNNYLCLFSGDNNGDGRIVFKDEVNITFTDVYTFVKPDGTTNNSASYNSTYGYYPGDTTMNGKVKATNPKDDPNYILFNSLFYGLNNEFMVEFGFMIEQIPN